MPVPVPVSVPVPVVLLAPLVCDSTNRAENTSPYIRVRPIHTSDTNHEPRPIFHLIQRMDLSPTGVCYEEGLELELYS